MFKVDGKTLLFRAATKAEADQRAVYNPTDCMIEGEVNYNTAYLARQCCCIIKRGSESEEDLDSELTYTSVNPVKAIFLRHAERYGLGVLETDLDRIINSYYVEGDVASVADVWVEHFTEANFNFTTKESAEYVEKIAKRCIRERPSKVDDDINTAIGSVNLKSEVACESVVIFRKDFDHFVEFYSPQEVTLLKEMMKKLAKMSGKAYCEKMAEIDAMVATANIIASPNMTRRILVASLGENIIELEAKGNTRTYGISNI